jgi:hypothetical protein
LSRSKVAGFVERAEQEVGVNPCAVMPSRPVTVPAARRAFSIAPSVAYAAEWESGVIRSLGIAVRGMVSGSSERPNPDRLPLPVAKARKMSPLARVLNPGGAARAAPPFSRLAPIVLAGCRLSRARRRWPVLTYCRFGNTVL